MNSHGPWCNCSRQRCHLSVSVPVGMIASRDGLKPDTVDWLILTCTLKEAAQALDLYTD